MFKLTVLTGVTGFIGARILNRPQSVLENGCLLARVEPAVFTLEVAGVGVDFLALGAGVEVERGWVGFGLLLLVLLVVRFLFRLKLKI